MRQGRIDDPPRLRPQMVHSVRMSYDSRTALEKFFMVTACHPGGDALLPRRWVHSWAGEQPKLRRLQQYGPVPLGRAAACGVFALPVRVDRTAHLPGPACRRALSFPLLVWRRRGKTDRTVAHPETAADLPRPGPFTEGSWWEIDLASPQVSLRDVF